MPLGHGAVLLDRYDPCVVYTYDAFGQRLRKALTGPPASTTLYQYDLTGHQIEDNDISSGGPSFQADYIYLGDGKLKLKHYRNLAQFDIPAQSATIY